MKKLNILALILSGALMGNQDSMSAHRDDFYSLHTQNYGAARPAQAAPARPVGFVSFNSLAEVEAAARAAGDDKLTFYWDLRRDCTNPQELASLLGFAQPVPVQQAPFYDYDDARPAQAAPAQSAGFTSLEQIADAALRAGHDVHAEFLQLAYFITNLDDLVRAMKLPPPLPVQQDLYPKEKDRTTAPAPAGDSLYVGDKPLKTETPSTPYSSFPEKPEKPPVRPRTSAAPRPAQCAPAPADVEEVQPARARIVQPQAVTIHTVSDELSKHISRLAVNQFMQLKPDLAEALKADLAKQKWPTIEEMLNIFFPDQEQDFDSLFELLATRHIAEQVKDDSDRKSILADYKSVTKDQDRIAIALLRYSPQDAVTVLTGGSLGEENYLDAIVWLKIFQDTLAPTLPASGRLPLYDFQRRHIAKFVLEQKNSLREIAKTMADTIYKEISTPKGGPKATPKGGPKATKEPELSCIAISPNKVEFKIDQRIVSLDQFENCIVGLFNRHQEQMDLKQAHEEAVATLEDRSSTFQKKIRDQVASGLFLNSLAQYERLAEAVLHLP